MTKYKQMPLGTKVMPGDRITNSISVPQGGEIDWTPNHEDIRSIERPIPEVVLPTVPGYYESARYPLRGGYFALRLNPDGDWYRGGVRKTEVQMREHLPLTRLVPEAAPSKLADRIDVAKLGGRMRSLFYGDRVWAEDAAALIAAIDNGEMDK